MPGTRPVSLLLALRLDAIGGGRIQMGHFLTHLMGGITAPVVGQIIYCKADSNFSTETPLTSNQGWLVNDSGILLIK